MFILHIETFRSHTVDVFYFSSVPVIPVLNVIDCSLKVFCVGIYQSLFLSFIPKKLILNFGISFTSQHAQILQISLLLYQMKVFQ